MTTMVLPWLSRSVQTDPVVDSAPSGDTMEASEVSMSPVIDGHQQLHSRSHLRSISSSYNGATTPEPKGDDPSGKDKHAPLPVKEAVFQFVIHNWLALLYSAISLSIMVVLVYLSYFAAVMDDGSDAKPGFLTCRSWAYGTACGLWGIDCRPFETDWVAIRCRARCTLDQSSSLAVYGTGLYRADSRICRAAIHAGVIGANGGCAMMRYAGAANAFYGSSANGVKTENFLTWFPKTIEFKAAPSQFCTDLTWPILFIGGALLFGYALLPHTNPAMLFPVLVAWGFFFVRIVGQPTSVDYAAIIITALGEVFILLAASHWLYFRAPIHTFADWGTLSLKQRVIRWGVCYVVPYLVFINMNMFEYLPWLNIDLGGHQSLNANVGTYIVLVILGLVVLYCAFWFLRELYRQFLWRKYVVWYGVLVVVIFFSWVMFNSTSFHLHHTMFGALLLPFTRFPTPLATAAQGALLGCFVQGYAAWGWSSYLSATPTYLTIKKPEDPPVAKNITETAANISWAPIKGVDGYSLRLNKVEVYRGTDTHAWITGLQSNLTYFMTVAGVAEWGTNGQEGPKANFTTLA